MTAPHEPQPWLPAHASPPSVMQPLVSIGDITVFPGIIDTPSGRMPMKGAMWTAIDNTREDTKIAPYAIILAILGIPITCGLSLLFLLIKETTITGHILVTVSSGGRFHTVSLPPTRGRDSFGEAMSRVAYARSISL